MEESVRELCALADRLGLWANVVIAAIGPIIGFSVHIPYLRCREHKDDPKGWIPTGYGDTVNEACAGLLKKLPGLFISYKHPGMEKAVEFEMPPANQGERQAA